MNKRRERERDRERGGTAMAALSEERKGTSNDGDERARDAEDRRAVRVVGGVGGRLARRGSVVGGGRLRGTAAGTGRRGRGDLRGGRRCNLGGRGDESRGGGGVEGRRRSREVGVGNRVVRAVVRLAAHADGRVVRKVVLDATFSVAVARRVARVVADGEVVAVGGVASAVAA